MDGVGGYSGWRWIFILEGLATVIVGFISFFVIYDYPETASFLTTDEREWVISRLRNQNVDIHGRQVAEEEAFSWKYVRDAFTDWQIYLALISKFVDPTCFDYYTYLSINSVLGCRMSTLWNFIFSSNNHQKFGIFFLHSTASNGILPNLLLFFSFF
jgi:hypothetical protein